MPILLGLDCGGSSTRAVAIDGRGAVLHQNQSGSANLASTPEFRIRRNLAHATQGRPDPDAVCACFAGLLTEDDRSRALGYLRDLFPSARLRAEPDYAAALFACSDETDVCVIAGTGSLVCSSDGSQILKSGGRGYLLGDPGSAFRYGRDALLQFLDNPKAAGVHLAGAIERYFGAASEAELVSRLYRAPSPPALLAKLARVVAQDAREGHAYALKSLERNSGELASVLKDHCCRHLRNQRIVRVGLTGGLWKVSSQFGEAFARALEPETTEYRLERMTTAPVYGALRLAKEIVDGD